MPIDNSLQRKLLRRFGWVLLVVSLSIIPLQAVQATTATADAITVTTTVHVDDLTTKDEVLLTSLASDPDGMGPFPLAVYWAKDLAGWFPTWQLELSSASGLLPEDRSARTKDGVSSVTLSRINPMPGHTYEVTLSYSATLGALAIKVYDVTDAKVLYADGFSTPAHDGPLYAVSGTSSAHYVPIATHWQPGLAESERAFLALQHFTTRSDDALIRFRTPSAVPGEYYIYHVHDGTEKLIAQLTPSVGEHRIPLDLTNMPLGTSTLRLDYVDNGEILLRETKTVIVGQLDFWMYPLEPERATGSVKTEFTVRGGEPYAEEIIVDVHATVLELVWDSENRTFLEVPYMQGLAIEQAVLDLSKGIATLPVEIPFPDHPANWKVVLSPEVRPNVATHVNGHERLFSSHRPADVSPDEPYTIVVFPDTQNMAQHFPMVYTRMTDWVTANAAEYNIAALLHVGDITNHDTPPQWLNAYTSMSLLHDVVPYALTLGNHDMTAGGGGSVKQRGQTLINNYFTAEEARRYSSLAGSMVPDRLENHYHLFSIGDDDYLVIALEFGPPDEAIDWANEIATQYPEHKMILLTHSYTTNSGGLSRSPANYEIGTNPDTTVNTAVEMWEKLMRPNANSFMVISGHTWPPVPVVPYRVARAAAGHPVFELLFDWQAEPNGGNGWLGMLTFHPDNTLEVNVYSPYLDEYAQQRDPKGFTSHMMINLETGSVQRISY